MKTATLKFSQISENITTLMNHCEIDAVELSRETRLPASTISRLRSNAFDSSPNLSSLIPIARYFEISVSQLIGEEPLPQDICGSFKPGIKNQFIPVLTAETMVGYIEAQEVSKASYLGVDFPVSKNAFAYVNQGVAMEPSFPDKTLLIVDPLLVVTNLDFVLVVPRGKKMPIFRQALVDGDEWFLKAHNPMFNELIKMNEATHQIIGVVIQMRRDLRVENSR